MSLLVSVLGNVFILFSHMPCHCVNHIGTVLIQDVILIHNFMLVRHGIGAVLTHFDFWLILELILDFTSPFTKLGTQTCVICSIK